MSNSSSTKPSINSGSKTPAKSMAELMAAHTVSFKTFHKGDAVTGVVTKLTKNEILVDIQAKSLAVVLEKEKALMNTLLSRLTLGDTVEVTVLNPESDMGNPVVSLRRFLSNVSWAQLDKALKSEEQLSVRVTDVTKGGLVVMTDSGLSGFLPNSHINAGDQLSVNKQVKVRVIEINRTDNKIIFSQKITIAKDLFESAIKKLKIGESVSVNVMNVVQFGVFVSVPIAGMKNVEGLDLNLDGLIHISEISWEKVEEIGQRFISGQQITAKIIGFDKNTRRVDLSMKQLTDDPFTLLLEKYPVDKKVAGEVTKLDENGVHIALDEGIEGLIRKDKIPPTVSFSEGQKINATVSEIDKRRRKIYLLPVLLDKPIGYR